MFQFSGFAPAHYEFMCRSARKQGLSHSEIIGSKPIRGSPTHIAAYHVLHRLSVPRHSPNALKSLDYSHYCCPSRHWLDTSFRNERFVQSLCLNVFLPSGDEEASQVKHTVFSTPLTALQTRIATEKLIVLLSLILLWLSPSHARPQM